MYYAINCCLYRKWKLLHTSSIHPTVPGPVSKLAYSVQSNSSAKVSWSEPEEPNGILLRYAVFKATLEGKSKITCNMSHSDVSSGYFTCTVDELGKKT